MANLQQNQPTFAIAKAGLVEGGGGHQKENMVNYMHKNIVMFASMSMKNIPTANI